MRLFWNHRGWEPEAFYGSVDRATSALRQAGIGEGHHVGVLTGNTPLHAVLAAASDELDAVLVPLHLKMGDVALRAQIMASGVDLLVTDQENEERAGAVRANASILVASADGEHWSPYRGAPLARPKPGQGGFAAILHTSGTTGAPRAVALPRKTLAAHAERVIERLRLSADDTWMGALPLYHVGGVALLDRCRRLGARLVLRDGFDAAEVLTLMTAEEVSHVSLVPTMLHRLLEASEDPAPAPLRCVLIGGDRCPPQLLGRATERGWPVHTTYGLTEACSQVANANPKDLSARPGTSGRPLKGLTVTIVGTDGHPTRAGEEGEIRVDGPTLGWPYANGVATEPKGGVATGDVGWLDKDGYLFVQGRRLDRIVSGGEKVDPVEIEAVLGSHPSVAEACVVGIDDPQWGSAVVAAIAIHPGSQATHESLVAHCKKSLAAFQVPKRFLVLKRLPKTPAGKLDRAMVRQWMARQTGPTVPT